MQSGLSAESYAIVAVVSLLILFWYGWLAPVLWRSDRLGLASCSLMLIPYGLILVALNSGNWLAEPAVNAAVTAASAGIQALLAIGLFGFAAYSVKLSRNTFATYRQERLDSTLPVIIMQIVQIEDRIEEWETQVVVRVLNGGTGPALGAQATWTPTSTYLISPSSPIALAPGEDFRLVLTGHMAIGMFHDAFGLPASPEWSHPGSHLTYLKLGSLSVTYADLHRRLLTSEADLVITFTNLVMPVREEDRSIRNSRQSDSALIELINHNISLPSALS